MGNKDIWDKKCECGCGEITNVNKRFINGHHRKGVKQSDEHKDKRVKSWFENGNSEKYSENWKNNNPSSTDKNKKRLKENNPAKTQEVKKKISENNPMKVQKNIDKIKETKLERYGDENFNNHELFKETFLGRYGVDNPAKDKELLNKRISTYANRLANGEYQSKNNWKCGYYIKNNGAKEWYDSSYELIKMVEYDDKKLEWTKKHGITIPFVKENGNKSLYVPDFLIMDNNKKIIVEIKGWIKKDDILKAEAAIEWCEKNDYEYYFLLGKELKLIEKLSTNTNSEIIQNGE
jgi:hypothetical protein